MSRKSYPTDLCDAEWEILAPLIPAAKPGPHAQEKATQGKSGFVPAVARWVIERSNAWMERCKSLVKNFEQTLSHATTKINLCFVRLILKRLATSS
jgi:transposase